MVNELDVIEPSEVGIGFGIPVVVEPADDVGRIINERAQIGLFRLNHVAPHKVDIGLSVIIGRKYGIELTVQVEVFQRFLPILFRFFL